MGERAAAWLTRYLADARPQLLVGEDPGAVFLATNGERLGATWLTGAVHRYIAGSGTGKTGSCHLFRHSAATLMVERGADIRYVQELLGHRDLQLHPHLHEGRPRAPGRHPRRHPPRSGARRQPRQKRPGHRRRRVGAPPPAGPQGSSADAPDRKRRLRRP